MIVAPMERAVKSILKGYFEEYVNGLDTNVNCSQLPATLYRLELKQQKVNEMIEESSSGCPFELTDGIIGSVKLMPSWSGNLEIVANDVRFNFAFSPIKAVKKAMMPAEDEETDLQDQDSVKGCGHGENSFQQAAPCYCRNHDAPSKRRKGEPVVLECTGCHMSVQTNYVDLALCPACSRNERRCMICGFEASSSSTAPPTFSIEQVPSPVPEPTPTACAPRPCYCSAHGTSEKRRKADPRSCACEGCGTHLSTNYVDFRYCPSCSERQRRCMCCGADVLASGAVPHHMNEHRRYHHEASECLPQPPPPQPLPKRRSMSTGAVRSSLSGDRDLGSRAVDDAGRRRPDAGFRSASTSGIRREISEPRIGTLDAPFVRSNETGLLIAARGKRQFPRSSREGLPQRHAPER